MEVLQIGGVVQTRPRMQQDWPQQPTDAPFRATFRRHSPSSKSFLEVDRIHRYEIHDQRYESVIWLNICIFSCVMCAIRIARENQLHDLGLLSPVGRDTRRRRLREGFFAAL